jgi:hypothetical protein
MNTVPWLVCFVVPAWPVSMQNLSVRQDTSSSADQEVPGGLLVDSLVQVPSQTSASWAGNLEFA